MSVTSNVHTGVGVQVWARSTTWVANELLRVLGEVVDKRGLDFGYMHENFEMFTNSFRTWVTGRYLLGVVLEVWNEAEEMIERYDLALDYDMAGLRSPDERYETYIERLHDVFASRPPLPDGCRYRVVVQLEKGAPQLRGWSTTTLRDTRNLERQSGGTLIDATRISVSMDYWI